MKKNKYNIIDLFCGAGGFSKGFESYNFQSVLAIDLWKDAIETYNFNHINKVGLNIDINEYDNNKIKELISKIKIDGIIGGPPCQGFSMVGTRNENDQRNSLYLQYVRFVENIKPNFFVLENVKGLLTLKDGFFKEDIIDRFSKLGYNVNFKMLKASNYGVPQNRERIFFVGLKKEVFKEKFFEFPEENYKNIVSTKDAISDLPSLDKKENPKIYNREPLNDFQKLMRKNSKEIFNHDITNHTQKTIDIISLVPDGGNIKSLPKEFYSVRNYNSAFKRMNSQLPSTTIDCGHRNYFHYKENRVPTVRESARIQSFPDDFIFLGSKTSQYKQVGNAVPPLLAGTIAHRIYKLLSE